ncbi:LysR substrate-binding domain-containing protein [Vulcaniibacterium tengchongense]|uniref:DNA-binding transcriptional LysR family regulator n=1 Tax=Vulcaniibacterium tengchongense TaxID=1273429 RepID=A0A3N4VFH4_9GAMM|nr:LysR substrate-binding domain-containing protein [Vulcaniibacterium tengchongense]RPE81762.1 DNA-binding transcriptional LysR family regulator [Vulcaniibacterium tengchongense]
MIAISPRQLEVFVAIALSGSVRAAAERLHLTQPAASMALSELERLLGEPLFDRRLRRLHLNAHGRRLLPLAQEILERMQEFGRGSGGAVLRGELRLGASNTVGNYLVGDLLGGFVAAHPQVAVKLHVDNTAAIVAGVLDYSLDLGCVEGSAAHPDLELLPWRDDRLCVCAPPSHPLAQRRRLRPEHFAGARWILREAGSATREQTERALAMLPPGETVLELDQSEAIKQAVIAGLGLALLPAVAVADAAAGGRLAVLRTPFLQLQRPLSLVLHRRRYRSSLLQALLERIAATAARGRRRDYA